MKKDRWLFAVCLVLCLLLSGMVCAEHRVFLSTETEPFDEGAVLLTLRIAGRVGGDCMLLSDGRETMLIDTGIEEFYPLIPQMLAEAGSENHIDTFFNTHPHRDHLEAFFPLLESGITVSRICTVFPHDYEAGHSVRQLQLIQAAADYGIPVADMKTGDVIPFGPAEITVLRVPDDKMFLSMTTNDRSAMLMIRCGDCSMLLTGDCEVAGQSILTELYDLKADIVKAPHHGYDSMIFPFLKNVDPELVFITNGSADTRVLQAQLNREGYLRYTFSTWGEITIQTDGTRWIVSQDFYPEIREHAEAHWLRMSRTPDAPQAGPEPSPEGT